MSNYTAEQVEFFAGRIENSETDITAKMLRAYAATLRQQAERGDGAVPDEVARVAQHMALAIEYIEKQYPNARQLDRGPIMRNLRRWRDKLLAVAPLLRAPAEQGGRVDEYALGWKMAAQWAGRDDLIADIGSPAYEQDKAANRITAAALAQNAQGEGIPHPDDVAVDCFAFAMKEKLAEARAKGRGGWQDKDDCPQQRLSDMLRAHVEKGDPRDVGNFAMFLHQRGESILPPQNAQGEAVAGSEPCATVADAVRIADKCRYSDDEAVVWVPESCYLTMVGEVERLETLLYTDGSGNISTHAERARVPEVPGDWSAKALDRCCTELTNLINLADDYAFDEMTVATFQTSIECIRVCQQALAAATQPEDADHE